MDSLRVRGGGGYEGGYEGAREVGRAKEFSFKLIKMESLFKNIFHTNEFSSLVIYRKFQETGPRPAMSAKSSTEAAYSVNETKSVIFYLSLFVIFTPFSQFHSCFSFSHASLNST